MLYTYISHSRRPKTYHGVTFYYGDKKEVSSTISDTRFVFCGSRPNPPTQVVTSVVGMKQDTAKQINEEQANPVVETEPTEKHKVVRNRKPKVSREKPSKVSNEKTSKTSNEKTSKTVSKEESNASKPIVKKSISSDTE